MKKILMVFTSLIILISPVYVFAEGEESTTPSPTPDVTPTPSPTVSPTPTPTETPDPTPTATPTETPEPTPNEDKPIVNTLSEIKVTGGTISPEFSSTIYEYTIKVTDASKFSITWKQSDDRTIVAAPELSKKDQLNAILNKGKETTITVTYTDKDDVQHSNKYVLKLDYEAPEKSADLSNLAVIGYQLDKTFTKSTFKYEVEIPNSVEEVTVTAIAEDPDATITYNSKSDNIIKNLSIGENNVKITIKNGNKTVNYFLTIIRKKEDTENKETEEEVEETEENKTTDNETKDNDKAKEEKEEVTIPKAEDPDPIINRIIVTLATLFGLTLGGIGIFFYIKTSPKRMKKEIMNERLKKEESPIVEVENTKTEEEPKKTEIIEDLVDTKEFKIDNK